MGIDATMFVKNRGAALSEADVRTLSADLVAAFGTNRLFVIKPGDKPHYPQGRHALEIVQDIQFDGGTVEPESPVVQLIEVHLWGRFYGPGYERGDWPTYDAICQWLELRLPFAEVWYGGDSSGVVPVWMAEEFRESMWLHFSQFGHDPYTNVFNSPNPFVQAFKTATPARRICDFCGDRPMDHYGHGKDYQAWRCAGCGRDEETKDGGATWAPREKERTR
jgi:hypothetical protein